MREQRAQTLSFSENSAQGLTKPVGSEASLKLLLSWPTIPLKSFSEDAFVGAWHPHATLSVSVKTQGAMELSSLAPRNWILLSSTSPLHDKPNGLVHASASNRISDQVAVAFRGYLLGPALHSWSPSDQIAQYWAEPHGEHNGVFSAVRIRENGQSIELITDAFGIAPLYYRLWNGVLLFATNPRFLVLEGDALDLIATRELIETGYLCGDLSLGSGIRRVNAGSMLRFAGEKRTSDTWFDLAALPNGDESITNLGLLGIERTFQTAMDRCLALTAKRRILPLSSGYDSRRILAALVSRKIPFEARTVRVLNKDLYDLDGHWTAVISREIGFPHEILEMPSTEEFVADDRLRRALTDSEVIEHTWMMQLTRTLPNESSLVFDGLGGDIFNNTGYAVPELYTCRDDEKLFAIAKRLIPGTCSSILRRSCWPDAEQTRAHVVDFLRTLPEGKIRADLAFVLLRARRGTGVWSQTMVPAGQITVFPYFDLDYVRMTLRFNPLEKIDRFIQDRCLAEFWPRFYAYPGTRRIPADCKPVDQSSLNARRIGCIRQLYSEMGQGFSLRRMKDWLSVRGTAAAVAAAHNDAAALRAHWWLYPFLSAMARHRTAAQCWAVG